MAFYLINEESDRIITAEMLINLQQLNDVNAL